MWKGLQLRAELAQAQLEDAERAGVGNHVSAVQVQEHLAGRAERHCRVGREVGEGVAKGNEGGATSCQHLPRAPAGCITPPLPSPSLSLVSHRIRLSWLL